MRRRHLATAGEKELQWFTSRIAQFITELQMIIYYKHMLSSCNCLVYFGLKFR